MLHDEPEAFWGWNSEPVEVGYSLPHNWEPHWYQEKAWEYLRNTPRDARALLVWHRRAGKDAVAMNAIACWMEERVGNYWHMLPLISQARRAIWQSVNPATGRRRIDECFPVELRKRTLDQEMLIEWHNGSTYSLQGSDAYDRLVGASVAGVVFSEYALANPSSWAYIRPIIAQAHGNAIFISTTRGRNHFYSMARMAERSENWFYERLAVDETKQLNEQQLQEAEEEYKALYGPDLGKSLLLQEYYCDWNAPILGAFFHSEMRAVREEGRIRKTVQIPGKPVHRVWDLGYHDDMVVLFFQEQAGKPVILDCYVNNSAGIEHYADVIRERGWNLIDSIDFVPHDARVHELSTGRSRLESMKKFGLNPWLIANLSKADGIEAARRMLPYTIFDERTEDNLVAALEQYHRKWDDDKKCFSPNEEKGWEVHPSDAYRYLAVAWRIMPDRVVAEKPPQPTGTVVLEGPPPDPDDLPGRIII